MKHALYLAGFANLFVAAALFGQSGLLGVQRFDLTAVPPQVPPAKYRLLIDPSERRPGNAALFYMRAALFSTQKIEDLVDKATDARDSKHEAEFTTLAAQVWNSSTAIPDLMLLASERDQCDWNTGIEERGGRALLPELNHMRALANFSSVRAAYQMEQGKIDDCLGTLREMYALSQNIAKTPILVSGRVGLGVTRLTNARLAELMRRGDSPNLFWALAALPRPIHDLHHSMRYEGISMITPLVPLLEKARTQELSAEEWRQLIDQVAQVASEVRPQNSRAAKYDFAEELKPGGSAALALQVAQTHYAEKHKMSADDVVLLDSGTVVGSLYFDQFQQLSEEGQKSLVLPYVQMFQKLKQLSREVEKARSEAPANSFLSLVPSIEGAANEFALADREVAALTAVEAIRSYAAVHDGKLPDHLEDVNETPVPANPMTDQPFDYRVQNDSAVLSSAQPAGDRLEFIIRILK